MCRLLATVPTMHCRQMYCDVLVVEDAKEDVVCDRRTPVAGRSEAPRIV